ncbi:MAG: alpha/beta hydrolase-fold protein [Bacteroidota bacterium]|nr:alpha/beta hydrolase-fold protein [Bacteroidota bacterium]
MERKNNKTGMFIRSLILFFPVFAFVINSFCIANPSPGHIQRITFFSEALGIEKSFNIYLPPGYDTTEKRYPVLYLFRGHEDEWKDRGNIKEIVDNLVSEGAIGEMIIVMPGLTFEGSFIGFPLNLLDPGQPGEFPGLGTGRFEDYMIQDLIPYVDKNFRTMPDRDFRATDGFSSGAYSSLYIAIGHPELFCSVGSYDGNLGYLDFDDPAISGELDDSIYMHLSYFDPYFGRPRNIEYMKTCNPANVVYEASPERIKLFKEIQFFILAASEDARSAYLEGSYLPRVKHFVKILAGKGIKNYWDIDELVMSPTADHDWAGAREYIKKSLPAHWKKFVENR